MKTIKTAKKQKLKESKGITLIALVITIIVLLILAGVTIATLTGDNGILGKANDAKTQTEQAKEDENLKIAIAGSYGTDGKLNLKDLKDNLENQGINYDKNNTGFPLEVTVNGEKKKIDENGNVTVKLESVADSKTNGTVFNDVTTLEDTYGNQVKIPKGFKIANDSATDVTGGIVIEDATYTNTIGSQFVWIPVGTGENAIKKANKETVDIALGRYKFTKNSDGTIKTSEYSGSFTEDTTANHNSSYRNAIAKDIEKFKTSANSNHGYYIGRYEAGKTGNDGFMVCKSEQEVWNNITQPKASEVSRNMYGSEAKVTSDLINSYAWDTAIVFVQKCGTESNSSTYSYTYGESSTSTSAPQTTGTNILKATSKVDKQCNIFDMAGNCREWTTETYSDYSYPCVYRGGSYNDSYSYTSYRNNYNTSNALSYVSFRPLLYL
ncbi:MAG TPA: formylglycine-generating enzyme family protein [Clostridiaceae bacterium]|nr:formylglycine-generating enzyme family protein [Clostridiaceae bacterium]